MNVTLLHGADAAEAPEDPVLGQIEAALRAAVKDPEVSAKLRGMAVNPGGTPSDVFRKMIDADIEKFAAVAKAANLTFGE